MLEVVQTTTARRLWRVSKLFKLPITDPLIAEMDEFDMAFYELSMIADDPELLEKYKNSYHDDEYDKWVEEFDKQQESKGNHKPAIQDIDDWEEVED